MGYQSWSAASQIVSGKEGFFTFSSLGTQLTPRCGRRTDYVLTTSVLHRAVPKRSNPVKSIPITTIIPFLLQPIIITTIIEASTIVAALDAAETIRRSRKRRQHLRF